MNRFVHALLASVTLISCVEGKVEGYELCEFPIPVSGEVNIAYDNFRGIPDGSWTGNTGALIGANFGTSVMDLFGVQVGGSYGVYDWYGQGPVGPTNYKTVQQQGFVTGGVFCETSYCSGLQAGLVVDWMFNKNFGAFALDPFFGQLRLQVGYLLNRSNEVGFWGTLNLNTAHKTAFALPINYRAISQVNLFWRHFFQNYAETMIWAGLPYKNSMMFPGKLAGQYIVGASFRVPLTAALNVEANGVYMAPQGNTGSPKFRNYQANVSMGLSYSFGLGTEGCEGVFESRPYLPVANNSNFLVDTNLND